jgi:von Willebrand factor type A domain
MSNVRMGLVNRVMGRAALALALGVMAGSGCHSSDSGSEVAATAGSSGSGGTDGGVGLNVGDDDASAGGQAGAVSVGPGECSELAGLGKCGTTTVQAQYDTANILLVIDKSGSMTDQPDGFTINKWDALKKALDAALNNVVGEINFGLVLYPFAADHDIPLECDQDCCDVGLGTAAVNVPIESGASGVTKILDAVNATAPGGGTPTAAALTSALQYFTTGDGAALKGQKFVLLATDGGPNCNIDNTCDDTHCTPNLDGQCPTANGNCCAMKGQYCLDDAAVVTQIKALATAGVSTFVVGIPGTEKYSQYLDNFATSGGVPNPAAPPSYYAVSAKGGVQGLVDVFTSITTHLVRNCDVALENTPQNLDLVNVAVDCTIVPYANGAGWAISGTDQKTLELSGDACHKIQTDGARRVDVVYGCPTVR